MNSRPELPPTAELLLDVRTPAELAFSPDGSRLAFALHATVADEGSFVPSDLYVVEHERRRRGEPTQLTTGTWSDRTPAWSPTARGSRSSPTGSRRGTNSRTRCPPRTDGHAHEPRLAATLIGSAESVAWSSDGSRLLVLAADPGSYGLDWSARAVNGADPPTDPVVQPPRRSPATTLPHRPRLGDVEEVGPPDPSVWEVDWDGDDTVVAIVSQDHSGSGWYQGVVARLDLDARTATTLYEPTWQIGGPGALARRRPRRGRRGLRERPRVALRQRHADRPAPTGTRPTLGRPADGGHRLVVRRRFPLVRAHRRDRERLRPDLAGRSARGARGAMMRSSATP